MSGAGAWRMDSLRIAESAENASVMVTTLVIMYRNEAVRLQQRLLVGTQMCRQYLLDNTQKDSRTNHGGGGTVPPKF